MLGRGIILHAVKKIEYRVLKDSKEEGVPWSRDRVKEGENFINFNTYLMCPQLSFSHHHIEINNTDNRT